MFHRVRTPRGVEVVGEDRPLSPDPLALVALQPAAVQSVAAFEVTDPALRPGSVARQPALGASGGRLLVASDEHVLALSSASAAFVGVGWNPPPTAISRALIPSRVSSATVPGKSVLTTKPRPKS